MGKVLVMIVGIPLAWATLTIMVVGIMPTTPGPISPEIDLWAGVVYDAPSASFAVKEDGTFVPTPKSPETIKLTTGQFTVFNSTGGRVQLLDVTERDVRPLWPVSSRAVRPHAPISANR